MVPDGSVSALTDRCVLYVFRCAVYWAWTEKPDAELSKWWNWKDGGLAEAVASRA